MWLESPQRSQGKVDGDRGAWSIRARDDDGATIGVFYGRTEAEARWFGETALDAWKAGSE